MTITRTRAGCVCAQAAPPHTPSPPPPSLPTPTPLLLIVRVGGGMLSGSSRQSAPRLQHEARTAATWPRPPSREQRKSHVTNRLTSIPAAPPLLLGLSSRSTAEARRAANRCSPVRLHVGASLDRRAHAAAGCCKGASENICGENDVAGGRKSLSGSAMERFLGEVNS